MVSIEVAMVTDLSGRFGCVSSINRRHSLVRRCSRGVRGGAERARQGWKTWRGMVLLIG